MKRKQQKKEKQDLENGLEKLMSILLKFTKKAKLKQLITKSLNIKLLDQNI
jgi:hypothetical protein